MPGDQQWQNLHLVLFEGVGLVSRERVLKFAQEMGATVVSREVGDEGRPHFHLAIKLKEIYNDKPLRDLIKQTFAQPGVKHKRNELYNCHEWKRKPDDYYLEEYICKGIDKDNGPDVVYAIEEFPYGTHHQNYWKNHKRKEALAKAAGKAIADDKSRQAQKIIASALLHFAGDVYEKKPMDVLLYVIDQIEGSRDDKEHAIIAQRILFKLNRQDTRVSMAERIYNRFFT